MKTALALLLIVGACSTPLPPDDGSGAVGRVYISNTQILLLESFPVQVMVEVSGDLPSPCHELHWSSEDDGEKISVEVYSTVELGQVCAQVLSPFTVSIPVGSFSEGGRSVTVNEVVVGEFSI